MDGYAVRAQEIQADKIFNISQRIAAGSVGSFLEEGTVARIFTGATMPKGADSVIMQEEAVTEDEGGVKFLVSSVRPTQNVRYIGEDITQGDVILAKGLQPKYNLVQDHEFPQYDYNYSVYARKQFKALTGLDPLTDIHDPEHHKAWRQFRYDSITNLVNDHLVPEVHAHKKQITAAVFPNWQSVRQEWHKWNLDGFLPMLYNGFYNRDVDFIEEETRKAVARLDGKIPVFSGIYRNDIPNEKLKSAFDAMKRGGGSGLAIFSLSDMDKEAWKIFKSLG